MKRLSKMIGLLGAFRPCCSLVSTQQSNAQTVCSNQTGTNNGFFYSFFLSSGSACMTMTGNFGGGNYSTTWSLGSNGNMVAGKGWNARINQQSCRLQRWQLFSRFKRILGPLRLVNKSAR